MFMACPQAEAKPQSIKTVAKIKKVKLTKKQLQKMKSILKKVYKKRYGELPPN